MQIFSKLKCASQDESRLSCPWKNKSHVKVTFSQILCFRLKDKLDALGVLMGCFESLCLDCYYALVFVCLMQSLGKMLWVKKMLNDFLIRKLRGIKAKSNSYINIDIVRIVYVVYVVEAFILLNWEVQYKYMSLFSSASVVCLHLFISIVFLYIGGLIS